MCPWRRWACPTCGDHFFSRIEKAGAITRPFRRGVFNRVALRTGPPVSGDTTSPRELQARVQALID